MRLQQQGLFSAGHSGFIMPHQSGSVSRDLPLFFTVLMLEPRHSFLLKRPWDLIPRKQIGDWNEYQIMDLGVMWCRIIES